MTATEQDAKISASKPGAPAATPAGRLGFLQPLRRMGLLGQMIALALVLHLVFLLLFSPRLFSSDEQSPERIYERAEAELARGHYPEAMLLFQKVMDLQPKLPPVFEKAAEQHRVAQRLAQRGGGPTADGATRPTAVGPNTGTAPATVVASGASGTSVTRPASRPVERPAGAGTATQPATNVFIPPELRGK